MRMAGSTIRWSPTSVASSGATRVERSAKSAGSCATTRTTFTVMVRPHSVGDVGRGPPFLSAIPKRLMGKEIPVSPGT